MWCQMTHRASSPTGAGGRSLASSAASGAMMTMLGQAAKVTMQFAGIALLSRLLVPAEFGLLAMVLVLVGIGEVLRDFGLSAAVLQAKIITRAQQSNLFWINTSIGIGLGACLFVMSDLVASFYDEPRLAIICQVATLIFVINGMSTQYRADLNRELRFGALALTDVCATAIGLAVALAMALSGLGIWALIVQQVVQAAVALIMTISFGRWLPGRPRRHADMRPLLKFGLNFACTQLINYLSRNIDTIVIGRRFGPEPLGLYNRAYQLLTLPLNQINGPATKVAFPVLARISDDQPKFDKFILRGQSAMLHLVAAGFSFAFAFAYPLIEIILGYQWIGSAPLFQALAVSGVVQTAAFGSYWVFLAKGLSGENLRYTLATKAILVLFVVVGSNWGVIGVAVGYSAATVLAWPIGLIWINAVTAAPVRRMATNCMQTIIVYAIAALVAAAIIESNTPSSPVLTVLFGLCIFIVVLVALAVVFRPYLRDLRGIYEIRQLLVERHAIPTEVV